MVLLLEIQFGKLSYRMGPHIVLKEVCYRRGRESGKLSCALLCPAETKQSFRQHYLDRV